MISNEIHAVLFDAGGTLVRIDYAYVADVAAEHGHALEVADLARGEGVARRSVDREAARSGLGSDASRVARYLGDILGHAGVPDESLSAVCDRIESAHRDTNLWRVAIDGAAEVLAGLVERGLRVAVVSNADGRAEAGLASAGLAEHLEFVLDSHHEGVEKPDPEIFRRALSRLGVVAERSLYVGDIYSVDAVGARSAGLAPVILDIAGGYQDLDCPVIRDLRELLSAADR